jgi:hypothetical protein
MNHQTKMHRVQLQERKTCLEHLRFDVMFRGKRYRTPANGFAISRMEPGKQREIQSMKEARDWERLFIGEIRAGRNPRGPSARAMQAGSERRDVSAFLDVTSSALLNRQAPSESQYA